MFICKDFVFVHLPKTGGTFVTLALRKCYTENLIDRSIHRLRKRFRITFPFYSYKWDEDSQHALCRTISDSDKGKPILSCVRDPVSLMRSHYFFGWWENAERWFGDLNAVTKRLPNFPDISLDEFANAVIDYGSWANKGRHLGVGPLTAEFIHYFSRDPVSVWDDATDDRSLADSIDRNGLEVNLLRQSSLANDLCLWLKRFRSLENVRRSFTGLGIVNRSRKTSQSFSNEVHSRIMDRERFLIHDAPFIPKTWKFVNREI